MSTQHVAHWAALTYWLHRVVGGILVGWFLSRPITRSVQHYPDPDAALFEPGAVLLADVITRTSGELVDAVWGTSLLAFVWALFGLLPLSALLTSFRRPTSSAKEVFSLLPRCLVGQVWISVIDAAVLTSIGLLGLATMLLCGSVLPHHWSERTRDLTLLVAWGPSVLLYLWTRPWVDACRVRSAAGTRPFAALGEGLGAMLRTPWILLWAWFWPQATGWLVLLALLLSTAQLSSIVSLNVGNALSLILQQLGYLALVSGRVVWLFSATRRVNDHPASAIR